MPSLLLYQQKFLGVHFDKFMTWDNHINHVHKQININLYLLKQIRNYLPLDVGRRRSVVACATYKREIAGSIPDCAEYAPTLCS